MLGPGHVFDEGRRDMGTQGFASLLLWQVDRRSPAPLFRQIQQQLRKAILSRALRPGAKLPATRDLAERLGVARSSVIAAFAELRAEGYITGRSGSGTYVSADLPEPSERGARGAARGQGARRVALPARARAFETWADGVAEGEERPFQTGRSRMDARTLEAWRKLSQRALRDFSSQHLGYTDPRGLPELRTAICEYLRAARAVRCEPEQILVTAGTQHALDLVIRVLLEPGDRVWVEDPGYPLTWAALTAAGIRARPIPVDDQGLIVRAGLRSAPRARAAYVTPSHQYPLGRVLSMARRLELLDWARESGAWIFEDDYDSEFRYAGRPLSSLQGLDEADRVLYVGTLNKVLFAGLRIGYVVVPPQLLRAFVGARHLMDRQPQSLLQVVLAEFMAQGHFASHVRRMRHHYLEQRDALVSELLRRAGQHVRVAPPEQGMRLAALLEGTASDVEIEAAARRAGVIVRALSGFYRAAPPRQGLLLGFTGHSREATRQAVARLAQVIAATAPTSRRRGC
jgi:GntR family transcriptional regulator/MocR family aminotransferase